MNCPFCSTKFRGSLTEREVQQLHPDEVMNKLSRRDNKTYICQLCGLAEAFADFTMGGPGEDGINDNMMRVAIGQEAEEYRRLSGARGPLTGIVWSEAMPL